MVHWVDAQGQVNLATRRKHTPITDVTQRKLQTQNEKKIFFSLN